ncbi:cell filamentation protein Fic [Paenibacillus macerans]|uniref:protein adenylyltransferase n=1 Tax=Paenibacillus macerans TaxID=44252 RepID=A0A6N8EVR1_PAEMA|nr:Fic family protein [Paenibacillus macerans]MED4954512.1 Fic family protein [Paenibacillus macerans]MUG24336.1 cell filamentation protein Fic [Paenibacillus macerans]UMV50345.1 Fic family protein [Paenibacillus macerans]
MNNNYDYSYEWDQRYCYPQSNVLINKLGITDPQKLLEAEREITSLRLANAKINIIKGNFDLAHLRRIHEYIFGDIYDWAGQIRWVNIAKGNMFCNYEYIESNANELFAKLKKENYLKGLSADEIPLRLSYYLGEINVLHPFREGNGRTQRLFVEYLAEQAGYSVDFSQVSDKLMIEASAASFLCDYSKMNEIFKMITEPHHNNGQSQPQ